MASSNQQFVRCGNRILNMDHVMEIDSTHLTHHKITFDKKLISFDSGSIYTSTVRIYHSEEPACYKQLNDFLNMTKTIDK